MRQLFIFFVEPFHQVRHPADAGFKERDLKARETRRTAVEKKTGEMDLLRNRVLEDQNFYERV